MEKTELYRRTEDGSIGFKYARGDIGIYPKCFHEHYEVFLLLYGEVDYIGESVRRTLSPGSLVLIPPGVYHQLLVTGDVRNYERYVLEADPMIAEPLHIPGEQRLLTSVPDSGVRAVFDRIRGYTSGQFDGDFSALLSSTAAELLILLRYERKSGSPEDANGSLDALALRAMEYVNTHLDSPLSAAEIADACFVSVSSVSHIFRENYGIPLMQYVRQKKMMQANKLLQDGKGAVETSRLCGYADYSTFYRSYCREFGHAPSV